MKPSKKTYYVVVMILLFCIEIRANKGPITLPDTTIDVQLTTNGTTLFSSGASGALKAAISKVQGKADTLVKQNEDSEKNIKVVTSQANAGKNHGTAQISVPQNYNLKFQTAIGDIQMTDLNTKVRGTVKSGSITATRVKGKIDVFTVNGNIVVTDSDASGLAMTQKGDITLQDVRSNLTPIAQNGKVTVKTTTTFFGTNKAKAMNMTYEQADLDIATMPEGGAIVIGKGNIAVNSATKNTELRTNEGNIALNVASEGVRTKTAKGNTIVKIALNSTSKEPILIESQDGDTELWIPRRFAGDFVIAIEQTKLLTTTYQLSSNIGLTNIITESSTNPKTKEIIGKRVHLVQKIGTNGRLVRIRAINGNVLIRYSN